MKLKGTIAAAYTPLDTKGELMLNQIENYHQHLIATGVRGVFLNGSTADFTSLNTAERMQITATWAQCKSEQLYIIDHVGHTNLRDAVKLAQFAATRVDAIAAIAPYYFKITSTAKLLEYCKAIASSAPNIPFYYYHIPVLSGVAVNMLDFLEKAIVAIPNFGGVKYTSDNFVEFKNCINSFGEQLNMLFGFDEHFVDSLQFGVQGWVGSTYNHIMPLYQQIKNNFENGHLKEAHALQAKAVHFVEYLNSFGGFNGAGKSFMKTLGVDCGPSRFPHTTLSDSELQEIVSYLSNLSIYNPH